MSPLDAIPANTWDVSAWRLRDGDHLDVYIDVRVDTADQRRVWNVIEKAVREEVAKEIEADLPPSVVTLGSDQRVGGIRDGLHRAAEIARRSS